MGSWYLNLFSKSIHCEENDERGDFGENDKNDKNDKIIK